MLARLSSNNGSAFIIVLALLALFGAMAISSVDRSLMEIKLSYNQLHEEQAFYVAQAGVNMAMSKLNEDPTWRSGFDYVPFGIHNFTLTVVDSTTDPNLVDTIVLTCVCQHELCKATVEVMAVPELDCPFQHAMYGDNSIDIRNALNTDSYNSDSGSFAATYETTAGDVGSNGTIDVANGAFIGGDVTTALLGGTDVNIGAIVTGDVTDDAPEQELEIIPQSEYDWAEANNSASTWITGAYSYDATSDALVADGNFELSGGVYFFSSIVLENDASLRIAPGEQVTIYVTGDIELRNASDVNDGGTPSDLIIYSQGDFNLTNSGDISAVFYSPDGVADLSNSGEFYGSIGAEDIIAHNSAGFHYDRSLATYVRGLTGVVDVVAWREII